MEEHHETTSHEGRKAIYGDPGTEDYSNDQFRNPFIITDDTFTPEERRSFEKAREIFKRVENVGEPKLDVGYGYVEEFPLDHDIQRFNRSVNNVRDWYICNSDLIQELQLATRLGDRRRVMHAEMLMRHRSQSLNLPHMGSDMFRRLMEEGQ